MKRINLIKMLFPSIHPPYISWFYLNQSNFFDEFFSQLTFLQKKKGENQDEATASSCLMLATALVELLAFKSLSFHPPSQWLEFSGP